MNIFLENIYNLSFFFNTGFGIFSFVCIYILIFLLILPASWLSLLSGFLYGSYLGSIIVFISASIGASVAFFVSKSFFAKKLKNLFSRYPKLSVIEKVVALAILMPIVASMGANAGTQTLTVAVRAIAVKELTTSNAIKIITKETLIGGINGIIFAIIISLISIYWFDNLLLGLIIGLAMILNLLIAGFSGIAIPLVLDKLKIDPALASAVILTTITDVFGFLSFLGLATLFLI